MAPGCLGSNCGTTCLATLAAMGIGDRVQVSRVFQKYLPSCLVSFSKLAEASGRVVSHSIFRMISSPRDFHSNTRFVDSGSEIRPGGNRMLAMEADLAQPFRFSGKARRLRQIPE